MADVDEKKEEKKEENLFIRGVNAVGDFLGGVIGYASKDEVLDASTNANAIAYQWGLFGDNSETIDKAPNTVTDTVKKSNIPPFAVGVGCVVLLFLFLGLMVGKK